MVEVKNKQKVCIVHIVYHIEHKKFCKNPQSLHAFQSKIETLCAKAHFFNFLLGFTA